MDVRVRIASETHSLHPNGASQHALGDRGDDIEVQPPQAHGDRQAAQQGDRIAAGDVVVRRGCADRCAGEQQDEHHAGDGEHAEDDAAQLAIVAGLASREHHPTLDPDRLRADIDAVIDPRL